MTAVSKVVVRILAISAFGLAGGPAFSDGSVSLNSAQSIIIDEWDQKDGTMGLTLNTDSIKAGPVTFSVHNKTEMKMLHEILLIPNPKSLSDLKLGDNGTKLDEEALEGLNEIGDVEPDETTEKTVTLEPGTYLLFCNQPGHFAAGMRKTLTVTR